MPRGASITASAVCLFRALEHGRGSDRRLDDPFAAALLPPALQVVARSSIASQALMGGDGFGLGAGALARYVVARHRTLDTAMLDFVAAGGRQVVILGAGLDARAWRHAEALRGVDVWEVDFPATQARKRALLARAGLTDRGPRFVAVDFERTPLEAGLLAEEFDATRPTCFLWEGVTMYLAPEAVVGTLEAVARLTPPPRPGEPPSRLVFDAWVPPSGSLRAAVRRGTSRLLGLIGEPFKFALAPDEAPRMLSRAGWRVRALHDRAGLATLLGVPSAAIYPDVCVVDAERAPEPETKETP